MMRPEIITMWARLTRIEAILLRAQNWIFCVLSYSGSIVSKWRIIGDMYVLSLGASFVPVTACHS